MNSSNKIPSEVKWTEEEVQKRLKTARPISREELFKRIKMGMTKKS